MCSILILSQCLLINQNKGPIVHTQPCIGNIDVTTAGINKHKIPEGICKIYCSCVERSRWKHAGNIPYDWRVAHL